MRARLAAVGGRADEGERVRFAPAVVERLIADAPKAPPYEGPPSVRAYCGVYQSLYLDPLTGQAGPFDEARLADYLALARRLPLIERIGLLGVPFVPAGIPAERLPLAERLYAWKYGAAPDGSVHFTALCQPVLDLCACHASHSGQRLEDVFTATGYLISPLKLARPECEQALFFADRGLRMGIGHMPTQAGSAPVTFAGALTLLLAEQLFLFLLRRALWEDAAFSFGASLPTLDLRRAVACFGRPEMQRAGLAAADIGRFYGCAGWGHSGLTDAKLPSYEAGAHKAIGALMMALATGRGGMEAGLLAIDEACSPVQMVLDVDLARSLNALLAAPEVDDLECAVEEIRAAGPGGSHLGSDFTAARHRQALFAPLTWAWQGYSGWLASGRRTDVDYAREAAVDMLRRQPAVPLISEQEERDLRAIIHRSGR
jgi:trimethylamine:corrinoid methyltransferase-like protein